jgi:hypothetical protein
MELPGGDVVKSPARRILRAPTPAEPTSRRASVQDDKPTRALVATEAMGRLASPATRVDNCVAADHPFAAVLAKCRAADLAAQPAATTRTARCVTALEPRRTPATARIDRRYCSREVAERLSGPRRFWWSRPRRRGRPPAWMTATKRRAAVHPAARTSPRLLALIHDAARFYEGRSLGISQILSHSNITRTERFCDVSENIPALRYSGCDENKIRGWKPTREL